MKIAFTSDLHADSSPANAAIIYLLVRAAVESRPDAFIIAGDIARRRELYAETLQRFSALACPKIITAGNHDIWVDSKNKLNKGIDSTRKYYEILPQICHEHGFIFLNTEPFILGGTAFVGGIGWYDYSFRNPRLDDTITAAMYAGGRYERLFWYDKEFAWWFRRRHEKVHELDRRQLCKSDRAVCDEMVDDLARQLAALPDTGLDRIVAVLHHLPFREMVRHINSPSWDFFSAFMGSEKLGAVLKTDRRISHAICGHTHSKIDLIRDGIRALCSPVGYLYEWRSDDYADRARDRLAIIEID